MTEEVIVETKNLTKKYKHNTALNNINLKLEKGKVYGFIGKNGAGKTTFIRIITGLAFLTSGELSLFGNSRDLQIKSFKDFKNLIEFVGYSLSIVLFLISVLNFINVIATEILRNMVNLSILEAIGMTKKNIKKYLVKKNLIYSLCGLLFSFIIMLLVDKFILMDFIEQTQWTSYKFVIMPLILVNFVNIIIGIIFTGRFYEKHSQNSLVDRIRSLE
ncbi:bacitracin ABC transporter ATP binding protein [Streptococcus pneumoniae]|uniref:ATPas n=1 Tax=Streptococcus pneumoniae TaxID=1313 RepID=A0AAJ5P113_STREE|nr:ATP-binding cassette domain-containing protein [Streptococcus pneumoniae]CCW41732.1 ATPas [Streptococcus agalactiae ILRI112]HEQ4308081.1 ATP-binding cassette domain-containing protein [Streptococcus pyogenes]CEO64889.1 bacitracin ABC transporter ATP binding protein [Streptococcus pneumoniae]CEW84441.1 bacitracin ABC transporter ATP binding protein [Streptococcus pneumoniae]CEX63595.1 bacitracin ABC transporter ATP binding protein [Streptococcus pneumoniae]